MPLPTPEQQNLNDQAVQALTEENYAKAISYLEEALYIGGLNVSYLNLGRAYQRLGNCRKAKEALRKVPEAPRVEKPAPAPPAPGEVREPTAVRGGISFASIVAGENFTCGIESLEQGEERVYCWGKNDKHQLGLASSDMDPSPVDEPRAVACPMSSSP